eukprot:1159962-Pelagomonas_calceolata.AAC.10
MEAVEAEWVLKSMPLDWTAACSIFHLHLIGRNLTNPSLALTRGEIHLKQGSESVVSYALKICKCLILASDLPATTVCHRFVHGLHPELRGLHHGHVVTDFEKGEAPKRVPESGAECRNLPMGFS